MGKIRESVLRLGMTTPAEKAALSAFIDSATSDVDPGYPRGAAFVPWQDTPQTDRILLRYLHEERPAVIVGTEDFDMLIEPVHTGRLARLRNELLRRITVEVSYRHKDAPPAPDIPAVRVDISRHALKRPTPPAA